MVIAAAAAVIFYSTQSRLKLAFVTVALKNRQRRTLIDWIGRNITRLKVNWPQRRGTTPPERKAKTMTKAGIYASAIRQIKVQEQELKSLEWLLTQAAKTNQRMSASKCFPAGHQSSMPDVVHHFMDVYGWEPATITRTPPGKSDIDLCDMVLPWFQLVKQPRLRGMLYARCIGMSLRKIGRASGVSHEKVRGDTDHAIRNMLVLVRKDLTKSGIFDTLCERLQECA